MSWRCASNCCWAVRLTSSGVTRRDKSGCSRLGGWISLESPNAGGRPRRGIDTFAEFGARTRHAAVGAAQSGRDPAGSDASDLGSRSPLDERPRRLRTAVSQFRATRRRVECAKTVFWSWWLAASVRIPTGWPRSSARDCRWGTICGAAEPTRVCSNAVRPPWRRNVPTRGCCSGCRRCCGRCGAVRGG